MVVPDRLRDPEDRRRRKRAKAAIAREAERQVEAIRRFAGPAHRSPYTVGCVLVVMAVVGSLLIGRARQHAASPARRTPVSMARRDLDLLSDALDLFRRDCGRDPTTDEGLHALIRNPGGTNWTGPYLTLLAPDPWRRPYRYAYTNGCRRLWSSGPDRRDGTSDDLLPTPHE
jgi:general secretion pathway protein G